MHATTQAPTPADTVLRNIILTLQSLLDLHQDSPDTEAPQFPVLRSFHLHLIAALPYQTGQPVTVVDLIDRLRPALNRKAHRLEVYRSLCELPGILTHHVDATLRLEAVYVDKLTPESPGRRPIGYRINRAALPAIPVLNVQIDQFWSGLTSALRTGDRVTLPVPPANPVQPEAQASAPSASPRDPAEAAA